MIRITERIILNDSLYEVDTINNDCIVESHIVHCKDTTIKKDNKTFFLLFDRHYALNKKVFNYINIYMDSIGKSYQTKEKTNTALKHLYSFLDIFNIKLEEITNDEVAKLLAFMSGTSLQGSDVVITFIKPRNASTINDYLSIIRGYVKYLGLNKSPLLASAGKRLITNLIGETTKKEAYQIKVKEYHRQTVPKHIKLDEFKIMQKYLHDKGDKKLEIIIRLMYESGLRRGEVLSLTYEDLRIENKNGMTLYKVILRNRYGNPPDRSPKFLMKIKDKKDYKSSSYQQKGYGWNEMLITKSLYEMILDYIEETHSKAQNECSSYWKNSIADKVDDGFNEENNFFIFLNNNGCPLSGKVLGNEIKELFINCGIKLNPDGGTRDGLCHRFRHGFAMYQVNYNNTPMALLKELMRHSSINSTAIYYTPETSDIIKIKDNLSKSVYDFIPEFNLNVENDNETQN